MKILIDNEEVLCDKNFTIEEEMLNTSSVILNNVYPKAWENDKDYVSRYYFPKDYSKCKIINKNEVSYEILGSTTQNGIPTPDNPVPIINKTGIITETIEGKNYTINIGNIELCKIGNYQDRIYKENDNWYLEKKVGKYVNEDTSSFYAIGNSYTNVEYVGFLKPNDMLNKGTYGAVDMFSNKLIAINNITTYDSVDMIGKITARANQNALWIGFEKNTGITSAREQLEGLILYYPLSTPTVTQITDELLINQLERAGENLLFCGVVKNTGKISLNPRKPHYCNLQVLDFKDFLSQGETLDFVIVNKTIIEAIEQIIETISDYGFILGNIDILEPNEVIGAYSTKDKTAYDVFNYIADITQSRWTTRIIDENNVAIDFYDPTLMEQGTTIEYTTEWFEDNNILDIDFSYSSKDYRNKQIMTSKEVYASISSVETKTSDGYNNQFILEKKIGYVNSIYQNGVQKTIATNEDKELGVIADFYYTTGNNYFESDELLSAGNIIVIDYIAIVQGRQTINNSSEIDRINTITGRKGVIARYEDRNDATTSNELQKIGQSYIKYKGSPEVTLKVNTLNNIWNIGERVQFNAPLEELTTEYMVKKKSIKYIASINTIFYDYELTSSFNSENDINYFDNQRNKSNGNIGAGEYISRNVDIENTAEIIFYDTELSEESSLNN